jgi:hypothetical protein
VCGFVDNNNQFQTTINFDTIHLDKEVAKTPIVNMMQKDLFDKENPRGGIGMVHKSATHKTASSFVLNRTPIEVTPVKRVPLGNIAENTPTSITSSRVVSSGGKEKDGHHSRGSIFSGAVRVPKQKKTSNLTSVGHTHSHTHTTPSSEFSHLPTTPRTMSHTHTVITPSSGAGSSAPAKKTTSGVHKGGKHSYMQTTEAYR